MTFLKPGDEASAMEETTKPVIRFEKVFYGKGAGIVYFENIRDQGGFIFSLVVLSSVLAQFSFSDHSLNKHT